jgi:hypothetical protein
VDIDTCRSVEPGMSSAAKLYVSDCRVAVLHQTKLQERIINTSRIGVNKVSFSEKKNISLMCRFEELT